MKRAHVAAPEPGLDMEATIWNAFVHLLAMSDPDELNARQRPARLVFWYESEVQNGGHLQYFLNRGPDEATDAVAALERLGAASHAHNLSLALGMWRSADRRTVATVDEYVESALEGELNDYDTQFHSAGSLQEMLENHLAENRELFVSLG